MVSLVFAAAGLAGLILLLVRTGFDHVLHAIGSVGWDGFALLVGGQLLLTVPLALAWKCVCPGASFPLTVRARLVRDAATNCLPFTSVGGIAFGARALSAAPGISGPFATASTVADATLEFAAQIAFVLIGLGLLILHHPGTSVALPLAGAAAIAALVAAGALIAQRRAPGLLRRLAALIGNPMLSQGELGGETLELVINRVHGNPARLAAGAGLQLVAWIGTGTLTWLTYRLLGVPIDFDTALSVEALLGFARSAAFFVPGSIGIQEAAYIGLGGLFGISASASLSLSLLRRGRELMIGVPVLLVWHFADVRLARLGRPQAEQSRR